MVVLHPGTGEPLVYYPPEKGLFHLEPPLLSPELDDAGVHPILRGGMWPSQRTWWELPSFVRLFVGGYGSGKTLQLDKRMLTLAMINGSDMRPHKRTGGEWYKDYRAIVQPVPVAIVSPTFPMARDTVLLTMEGILDSLEQWANYWRMRPDVEDRWVGYRVKKTAPYQIDVYYKRGSHRPRCGRILIYSGENPDKLKGPNLAAAGIDEPFIQDLAVFEQMIARCRHPRARQREVNLTGCVVPETLVLTDKGIVTIDSLDPGTKPKTFSNIYVPVYGHGGFHKATKFYNNGVDDAVRLTLAKGFQLTCTPDHPVMVMGPDLEPVYKRVGSRTGKYAHLEQLDPAVDAVAVARGADVWAGNDPEELTLDDAYACGIYTAEGSMTGNRVTITCGDRTVLDHFRDKGFFGVRFLGHRSRDDQIRKADKGMAAAMQRADLSLTKSPMRRLPQWVMGGGSRDMALEFLGGLYDGDGHVCLDGRTGIGYTTTSPVMARQLHVLLGHLGVCADIIETVTEPTKRVKVSSRRWQIIANGQNAKLLASLLPLRIKRKAEALALYDRDYRDSDCLPNVGKAILALWDSKQKQRWHSAEEDVDGYRICESIRQAGTGVVSYSYVSKFCQLWRANEPTIPKEILKLEDLVASHYFWAPVRSLEVGLREDTVDFVIPDTHTFITGQLLGLNTPEQLCTSPLARGG